ncbi:MAG: hypothetical protein HGB05_11810, partial [Chloroflexi bacterium]|nr:hypothetical protein [Chloroflexota bacterium]
MFSNNICVKKLLSTYLEHQPTMPLNQACEDWASTKAAY